MQIAVGSKNPAKVDAVRLACHDLQLGGTVVGIAVDSGVSKQPFSDEETITGAINRAHAVLQQMRVQRSESHDAEGFAHTELHRAYGEPLAYGIGLEGGVVETPHGLFVCNWGAVVRSDGAVGIGGGHRVQLPPAVAEQLYRGEELGTVMDEWTGARNLKQREGAIGVLTDNRITRAAMFRDVVICAFAPFVNPEYYNH